MLAVMDDLYDDHESRKIDLPLCSLNPGLLRQVAEAKEDSYPNSSYLTVLDDLS